VWGSYPETWRQCLLSCRFQRKSQILKVGASIGSCLSSTSHWRLEVHANNLFLLPFSGQTSQVLENSTSLQLFNTIFAQLRSLKYFINYSVLCFSVQHCMGVLQETFLLFFKEMVHDYTSLVFPIPAHSSLYYTL
jgi:hypothetical protein